MISLVSVALGIGFSVFLKGSYVLHEEYVPFSHCLVCGSTMSSIVTSYLHKKELFPLTPEEQSEPVTPYQTPGAFFSDMDSHKPL